MATNNPYDAPKSAAPRRASHSLLFWSALTVFGSALAGGLLGLATGAGLGNLIPSYYRSVFSNGSDPTFDPLAVGIGPGLTQGLGLGCLVGLGLVAMFYWHRSRLAEHEGD